MARAPSKVFADLVMRVLRIAASRLRSAVDRGGISTTICG
jgi:hypothetical protein